MLIFMSHLKNDSTPIIFKMVFNFPNHQYPTGFARNNFVKPKTNLNKFKFRISVREPVLWSEILSSHQKRNLQMQFCLKNTAAKQRDFF